MEQSTRNPKKRAFWVIFWIVMPVMLLTNWTDHMFTRPQRTSIALILFFAYVIGLGLYLFGAYEEKKARISESR